jgi:hypothetical protein
VTTVSEAPVKSVAIAAIHVGVRRRQKLGNLQSLKRSITKHGLIHPILIRNGAELVSGERRLEACRRLGWTKIPARSVDGLGDEELRALELEENTERLDLLPPEARRERLAEIRQEEAAKRAGAATQADGANSAAPRGRKRPHRATGERRGPKGRRPGSQRSLAEAVEVHPRTVERLQRDVAFLDRFPFMQRTGWLQHQVLEGGGLIEALPAKEHPAIAGLLDQEAIPPKKAIAILENLGKLTPTDRAEIYAQAKSDDVHERGKALTRAAALPPMPDPGLIVLGDAREALARAVRVCRLPELQPKIQAVLDTVKTLIVELRTLTGGRGG